MTTSTASMWTRIPTAFKGAAVVGIVGFFVSFADIQQTVVNGAVTSCSFIDYAGFVVAGIIVVCVLAGYRENATRHIARRLELDRMVYFSVVLGLLAGFHLIRGAGVIGGSCPI